MNAPQNSPIKMIASFNRGIFIPLVGINEQPDSVYNFLKEKNARISLDRVKNMMEGREEQIKDFEVLTCYGHHGAAPQESIPAASKIATQPASVRPSLAIPKGPLSSDIKSSAPHVAKGRGREYPAKKEVKPLKRGTVYATLMEMLVHGATMKEMVASTGNTTAGGVNDVLSWKIKQHGYGLRFERETGKYHLVMPEGQSELLYKD